MAMARAMVMSKEKALLRCARSYIPGPPMRLPTNKESRLEERLSFFRYIRRYVIQDENTVFRVLSDQLFGTEVYYPLMRRVIATQHLQILQYSFFIYFFPAKVLPPSYSGMPTSLLSFKKPQYYFSETYSFSLSELTTTVYYQIGCSFGLPPSKRNSIFILSRLTASPPPRASASTISSPLHHHERPHLLSGKKQRSSTSPF